MKGLHRSADLFGHDASRFAALVSLALLLLAASTARAQQAVTHTDWLRALPTCAMGADAHQSAPTKLLYPRPGLPAVVEPGAMLVARVRLPTPLTPPPGFQQEKALRGWSVELLGRGVGIQGEYRYELRVADVRPDAHEGLVYRASIRVPAWAAPGSYDLRIVGPWSGEDIAVASVRILQPDQPVRFGAIGADVTQAQLLQLQDAPVDVWVAEPTSALRHPLRGQGLVWLDRTHPGAVMRQQSGAIVLGGCDDRFSSFAQLLARYTDGADGIELPRAGASQIAIADSERSPNEFAAVTHVGSATEGRVECTGPCEVSLVVAEDGLATELEGAELVGVWPATPPRRAGHVSSVLLRVAADGSFAYRRIPGSFSLEGPDATVVAGHVVRLTVQTSEAAPPGQVIWSWAEDETAATPIGEGEATLETIFRHMEDQRIHLYALDGRGLVARDVLLVRVETDRPRTGCAAAPPGPGSHPPTFFGLLLLAWYGSRRRRLE